MASRENHGRTRDRASRKRSNGSSDENPIVKKRVVLGELTNIVPNDTGFTHSKNGGKIRKQKPEPASKKTIGKINLESIVFSPGSDEEQQKVGHASSIYHYLHSLEVEAKNRPLSNYMEIIQKDINSSMREVLVDWLVEVAEEYKLVSDTLYLTVNYIDRYLSSHNLIRTKLQLLGVTCMLIASKYEEISPPHVEDFCYITDNTYTKEEIVDMEIDVLKFLNYEMGSPTTKTFLRIFIRAAQEKSMLSNKFDFLCHYLGELSLLDYGCVRYIPSMVAASAIFLSRLTIQPNIHPWSLALQQHTGYKPHELKECVLKLHNLQLRNKTFARAVRQKYMDHKFKCVASLKPPVELSARFFEVPNE